MKTEIPPRIKYDNDQQRFEDFWYTLDFFRKQKPDDPKLKDLYIDLLSHINGFPVMTDKVLQKRIRDNLDVKLMDGVVSFVHTQVSELPVRITLFSLIGDSEMLVSLGRQVEGQDIGLSMLLTGTGVANMSISERRSSQVDFPDYELDISQDGSVFVKKYPKNRTQEFHVPRKINPAKFIRQYIDLEKTGVIDIPAMLTASVGKGNRRSIKK